VEEGHLKLPKDDPLYCEMLRIGMDDVLNPDRNGV
jgi:hypothetical protein